MLASFRSDFYLLRSYLPTIFVVFLFIVILSFVQGANYFLIFYPAFVAAYLPISLFSLSEQTGWETMLLSAPVTRRGIVCGRYLLCAATDLTFILIGTCVSLLQINQIGSTEIVTSLFVSLSSVLLLNAIILPIIYHFGPNKARFVIMAVFLIPILVPPLLLEVIASDHPPFSSESVQMLTSIPFLLLLCAVSIVFWLLSCRLSCFIYGKKEF